MNKKTTYVAQAGMIAAVYAAATLITLLALQGLAWGPVQFRISEAVCVLAVLTPAAVPGLTVGCIIANLMALAINGTGALGMLDVVFGSLATLIGAVGSWHLRRHKWLVCLPPIIANTLIVPWVLRYAYGAPDLIIYMIGTVGIGEILAVGVLGNTLLAALDRYKGIIFRHTPQAAR